jgi:hypothetical protein
MTLIRKKSNEKKDGSEPLFVERPVPTKDQVKTFEQAVKKEVRQEEIDDNLSEIYRDKSGNLVDVSHLYHKKDSVFVLIIKKLFVFSIILSLIYGVYYYFSNQSSDTVSASISINSPEKVKSGEEFSYTVSYKNNSKFELNSLKIELKYPNNFVVTNISGNGLKNNKFDNNKNSFDLLSLPIGGEANLTVSGRLFDKKDSVNLFAASLSYEPGTFSSEFKKEAVSSVMVSDLGFDLDFEYTNAALVDDNNQVDLIFSNVTDNFYNDFELSFSFPENINLINSSEQSTSSTTSTNKLKIDKISSLVWQVSGLSSTTEKYHLPINYKVNKKVSDSQEIVIRLSKRGADGKSYIFAEKNIQLNVMNSNLNLTLILNGSKNDGAASFGDTLNYSLVYSNKSDAALNDIVLMGILKSDFLDWQTLNISKKGLISDNSITWTKEQIPELANLAPGAEGIIDFSIKIRPYNDSDLGKSFNIISYSQFNINNRQSSLNDNKSNNINTKINSDLNLVEKILYFDDNNTPVGFGPLPPKVDQRTSVRVYWLINNNLHELGDTKVSVKLPSYISFDGNNNVSVGNLSFDPESRVVTWNIGNLPVSVYKAQAEFNISVTPNENQKNSLLVLLPGSTASAVDLETKALLEKKVNSKTSKLEDDDIANLNNSGLVE